MRVCVYKPYTIRKTIINFQLYFLYSVIQFILSFKMLTIIMYFILYLLIYLFIFFTYLLL